jgi:hypothetical protein
MYFYSFAIISPWRRAIPFIWTNLNPLHPRMICAKSCKNWSTFSGEEVKNVKVYRRMPDNRRSEKLDELKTEKFINSPKMKGCNSCKTNQSIQNMNWNNNSWLQSNTPSFNLIHVVAKMAKKKSGKLKKSKILLSSRGITHAKMNQSHRNANWNSNSWLQSNTPSFNPIAAKMAKKVRKTVNVPGQPDNAIT